MHRLNTVSNEYGKKITIEKDNVILLKTSKGKTSQNRATRNTLEERNKTDERMLLSKGPSIYDVHKKITFLTPSPCPHASTWAGPPYPPSGRPHTVDMKYTPVDTKYSALEMS